jgi:hypothetical protein
VADFAVKALEADLDFNRLRYWDVVIVGAAVEDAEDVEDGDRLKRVVTSGNSYLCRKVIVEKIAQAARTRRKTP